MARRFGSAMISNTDSTLLIYSTAHIRVKAYKLDSRTAFRRGGSIELEQMDSADPPLDVDRLYADRYRQLRRVGAGWWHASAVDNLLAAAAACLTLVHRSLFVRVSLCRQVARATHRLNPSVLLGLWRIIVEEQLRRRHFILLQVIKDGHPSPVVEGNLTHRRWRSAADLVHEVHHGLV